jgi:hypothetical protein
MTAQSAPSWVGEMVKSQFGAQDVGRDANECRVPPVPAMRSRRGEVTRYAPNTRLIVCLWSERGKCDDAGVAVPYPPD